MSSGKQAEEAAALYLENRGYTIVAKNWRRPYCEIDIIARKTTCHYFVEVKYRSSTLAGDGLAYITPQKLKQMQRAAQWWLQENNISTEVCLSAIAVSGDEYEITDYLEEVS